MGTRDSRRRTACALRRRLASWILGLLTRALKEKQVDLITGNTTDGLIPALDLFVLRDDRNYFPPYEAVAVMQQQMLERHPEVGRALDDLAGKSFQSGPAGDELRGRWKHRDIEEVVREFLHSKGSRVNLSNCRQPRVVG